MIDVYAKKNKKKISQILNTYELNRENILYHIECEIILIFLKTKKNKKKQILILMRVLFFFCSNISNIRLDYIIISFINAIGR